MANSMTGRVHFISPTETVASKSDATKTFQKRMIVLDCTRFDQYTGERGFENYPSFEFGGDKCSMLDGFNVGDVVTVSFDLQGRKFTGEEGKERWFTTIRGYKVEFKRVANKVENNPATLTMTPVMQRATQQLSEHGLIEAPSDAPIDDLPF